jgi:hypothetical protein
MAAATRQSAVKLVELAAAIAVTCILAAVAYSAYRTYEGKRQVADGIAVASELIPFVTEHFRRHGEVPTNLDAFGGSLPRLPLGSIVRSVSVVDGRIDVVYDDQADAAIAGRQLSLTPFETVERSVVWICGNRIPDPGLEPLGFAGGGRSSVQIPTTIERRYLSRHCR